MDDLWSPRVLSRLYPSGMVESYFIKINHPQASWAVWIKYTFHKPSNQDEATAACWFVFFDRRGDEDRVKAFKQVFDLHSCRMTASLTEMEFGPNRLSTSQANGGLAGGECTWDLSFPPVWDALCVVPRLVVSDAVPLTKVLSPMARSTVSGTVKVGGETFCLESYPMSLGHNWGRRHAGGYVWGQLRGQSEHGEVFLEGFSTRLPVVGRSVTSIGMLVGGRKLDFTGVASLWSNRGSRAETPDLRWSFYGVNDSHEVTGSIFWEPDLVAGLRYFQPDGRVCWCRNSMLSSGDLTLTPRFPGSSDTTLSLTVQGTAALETLDEALPNGMQVIL